ncbi:MAG TPA: hypothetical protein VF461_18970 [Gemmatimonadaceae bacterium]
MTTPPLPPRKYRSRGRMVLAVVFVLLASSAWWQVINDFIDRSNEPPILTGLQAIIGVLAAAAAWGTWIGARWAPLYALLYGVTAGGMVASLGRMLDLPAESRNGLWFGGAIILGFGLLSAWWLRRSLLRERARETSHIVGFD